MRRRGSSGMNVNQVLIVGVSCLSSGLASGFINGLAQSPVADVVGYLVPRGSYRSCAHPVTSNAPQK